MPDRLATLINLFRPLLYFGRNEAVHKVWKIFAATKGAVTFLTTGARCDDSFRNNWLPTKTNSPRKIGPHIANAHPADFWYFSRKFFYHRGKLKRSQKSRQEQRIRQCCTMVGVWNMWTAQETIFKTYQVERESCLDFQVTFFAFLLRHPNSVHQSQIALDVMYYYRKFMVNRRWRWKSKYKVDAEKKNVGWSTANKSDIV